MSFSTKRKANNLGSICKKKPRILTASHQHILTTNYSNIVYNEEMKIASLLKIEHLSHEKIKQEIERYIYILGLAKISESDYFFHLSKFKEYLLIHKFA